MITVLLFVIGVWLVVAILAGIVADDADFAASVFLMPILLVIILLAWMRRGLARAMRRNGMPVDASDDLGDYIP